MYSQPTIKELAQLKGQKVGVSRLASVSHLTAQSILQRAGVTGVTIIQTGGIPESTAALSSGNVAAAMVPPPQSVLLRENGLSRCGERACDPALLRREELRAGEAIHQSFLRGH